VSGKVVTLSGHSSVANEAIWGNLFRDGVTMLGKTMFYLRGREVVEVFYMDVEKETLISGRQRGNP
jgi:hypothetical protein